MRIFEYQDYRKYLRDFYAAQKARSPGFSFATLARQAGLGSRATFKLVMDGKRNLGAQSVGKFARALKLSASETIFFEELVRFNQATHSEDKQRSFRRLQTLLSRKTPAGLGATQARYFAHWYYPVIRELVLMQGFPLEPDAQPAWLSQCLGGAITSQEARRALRDLLALRLLRENEGGRLEPVAAQIASTDEVIELGVRNFQSEMIRRSIGHLDSDLAQREFGSVTLAFRQADLAAAKQAIKNFRSEFNRRFSASESADEVRHLGIQFFRLTSDQPRSTASVPADEQSKP